VGSRATVHLFEENMISLFSYLRSNRLLTPAYAAFAMALAACGADATSPQREATAGSSQEAAADAGKTASHPSTADAGSTASHPATADASHAGHSGAITTGTGDDAGSAQTPSSLVDGAVQASSGAAEYSWPPDCETHYTFRAHNTNGVQDASKKQVAAGAQYYASYYFRAPWTTQEVQGLKFRSMIDNKKIVHHWILYGVDSATQVDGSVQGGAGQSIGTMQGEFYIAGWAPGAPDVALPDDVGLHLPTGASATFRLEVHYFNTASTAVNEEDATGVEFCVTSHKRLHEAAVHWLGTTNIVVPPGTPTDLKSTCTPKITNGPVHLLTLSAHMHKTGVHARAMLNRANGDAPVMLIDDPFTFAEQNAYHEPRDGSAPDVQINAGDTIDVTCSYENMTGATKRFGSNTEDEMCFFYALAWPRGQLSNGSFSIVPGAEPEVNCIQ
jgi:Copper type II ascorbate-dependent monooxygenase, C-terminal domain/Copper type II ascorbate-dependent monooxygenase, N-terminal domain